MALETWDQLALQLAEYGFRPVFYFEICCPTDGTWRLCLETWQADEPPLCPVCQQTYASSPLLCRAFTRQELPKPEKLMGALGGVAQNWLRAMEDSPVTIKVRRKPKPFKLRRGWNPIHAKRPLGR